MKTNILVLAIVLVSFSTHLLAQNSTPLNLNATNLYVSDVISQMKANASPIDSNEGGEQSRINFFEQFWQDRAFKNNSSGSNMFQIYFKKLRAAAVARQAQVYNSSDQFRGNWQSLGPDSLSKQAMGLVSCIWSDPSDSLYILAGTWGGLFKTVDGGKNWECITDNTILAGGVTYVNWIAVNPLNKNSIMLGTSAVTHNVFWPYSAGPAGAGIIKTFDGGNTWTQEFIQLGATSAIGDTIEMIQKVYFTPDSTRIYALNGNKIFTRNNTTGANSWQDITPIDVYEESYLYDLEFEPGNQNHFFIANMGPGRPYASIWESTVAVPNSWNKITSGLSASLTKFSDSTNTSTINDTDFARFELSIPNSNEVFAIGIAQYNSEFIGLFKYNLNTQQWSVVNNKMPYDRNPSKATFELIVSPANNTNNGNRHNIYYGIDVPYHSYNGGNTFVPIGTYNSVTHADIRGMHLAISSNTLHGIEDRLYIANDGGVSVRYRGTDDSIAQDLSTTNINGKGLTCGHSWSVATSEAGGSVMTGMTHDGVMSYEPQLASPWKNLEVADATTVMFDNDTPSKAYALTGITNYGRKHTQPGGGRQLNSLEFGNGRDYPSDKGGAAPPMLADYYGTHYTGLTDLWHQPNRDSPWVEYNTPNLAPYQGSYIHDIAMSPYYSNFIGYVLHTNSRIQYFINPSAQNIFEELKNIPAVNYYPITCVEMDPQKPERVWVGMGSVNYSTNTIASNRVHYSLDGGGMWIDISKGLPIHMPVTKLLYHEGNETLICATDVGIYKCDLSSFDSSTTNYTDTISGVIHGTNHSVEWQPFNEQKAWGKFFPNTYVTDLKINHCNGKLYAATYGRSVWETDLFSDDDIVKPSETITNNTTWTQTKYIRSGIRIKSGVTLTISGTNTTIFMPKNGVIVIEPNAKLIVNDATITNGCEECLWGGIRVAGDLFNAQSTTYQGKVELNDATISNAIVAIGNYDENKNTISTGGIIEATNSTFLNNERSVDLFEYNSAPYSAIKNYQAKFTACTFEINDDYKFDNGAGYLGTNPHRFFSHVGLFKVDGVQFKGCEFYNRNTGQYEGWGEGITSTNAGFTVQSHCTNPNNNPCLTNDLVQSQFRGFKHGIWIERDIQNNLATKVDQAQFDSCSFGIRVVNPSYSELTRNEFTIGNGKEVDINNFDCHKNVGIYATSALAPIIEDNSFQGVTHSGQHQDHENIGAVIENIGNNNVQVYKNSFDDLSKGCLALGNNDLDDHHAHVSYNNKGVKFLCNSFADNTFDIYVSADPAPNGHVIYGIANYQGDSKSDAGNTFSTSPTNHIYNTGAAFNYFYDPALTNGQPTSINSASQVTVISASDNNECPSHYKSTSGDDWNTPLTGSGLTGLKANFLTYKDKRDNAQDLLDDYIDNGNTAGLTTFIDNSMVVDTPIVRDTLMKTSPYVSETVLRSTANINTLEQTVLIDILKANPEVLRDEIFLSFLENEIPNPLSSTQIDDLRTTSTTSTNRTTLEAEASEYDHLISTVANVIIGHYLIDTPTTDLDSIPVWYDHINTLDAEYAKVAFYTGIADYSTAETVMDNIPTKFTLTQEQSDDYDVYVDLWTLFKGVLDDDRNMFELTTTEETNLNTILTTEVTPTGGMKQNIDVITDIYGPPARLACFTSIGIGEQKRGTITNNSGNSTIHENSILNVYPNPANDYVIFEYNFKEDISNLHLEVINTLGQSVYKQTLQGKSGRQYWNTSSIASGVYNYSIIDNGKKLESGKVVIQK